MATLATLGIYFVVPAGYIFDRFGPAKTAVAGSLMQTFCFAIASLCQPTTFGLVSFAILLLGCGFGAGKKEKN